jgi:hypothetical protein
MANDKRYATILNHLQRDAVEHIFDDDSMFTAPALLRAQWYLLLAAVRAGAEGRILPRAQTVAYIEPGAARKRVSTETLLKLREGK